MKLNLRILTLVIINFWALAALAAPPVKYFEDLSSRQGFGYNYISPTMLKMMGDSYLSASSASSRYDNLPIQCRDLTTIENVSTSYQGSDEDLWKIIRKIKRDNHMDTLTTKKIENYRYDVLVTLTKDGKHITHLLVITQNGMHSVDVIYMEGKIPLESIQYSFY